jgi:hypothetical protein
MVLTTLQHLCTVSSTCTISCIFLGVFLHCPLPRGPARLGLAHGTHHAPALRYGTIASTCTISCIFLGVFLHSHCLGDLLSSAWHMVLTTKNLISHAWAPFMIPYLPIFLPRGSNLEGQLTTALVKYGVKSPKFLGFSVQLYSLAETPQLPLAQTPQLPLPPRI